MWTQTDREMYRCFLLEERVALPAIQVRAGQSPLIGDICVRWIRIPETTSEWSDSYLYTGRVLDVHEGHALVETFRYWWRDGWRSDVWDNDLDDWLRRNGIPRANYFDVHSRQLVPLVDFSQFWTLPDVETRAMLRMHLRDADECRRLAEEYPPEIAVEAAREASADFD